MILWLKRLFVKLFHDNCFLWVSTVIVLVKGLIDMAESLSFRNKIVHSRFNRDPIDFIVVFIALYKISLLVHLEDA